jgi:hypothetical protein
MQLLAHISLETQVIPLTIIKKGKVAEAACFAVLNRIANIFAMQSVGINEFTLLQI